MFQRLRGEIWPGDYVSVKWFEDLSGHVQKQSNFVVAKRTVDYPWEGSNYRETVIEDIFGEKYNDGNVTVEIITPAIVPWQLGFVVLATLDFKRLTFSPNKLERDILSGEITLVPGLEPNMWSLEATDKSYEGEGVENLREIDLDAVYQGRVISAPFEYYDTAIKHADEASVIPSTQFESDSEAWDSLSKVDKILFHLEAASYFGPGNS